MKPIEISVRISASSLIRLHRQDVPVTATKRWHCRIGYRMLPDSKSLVDVKKQKTKWSVQLAVQANQFGHLWVHNKAMLTPRYWKAQSLTDQSWCDPENWYNKLDAHCTIPLKWSGFRSPLTLVFWLQLLETDEGWLAMDKTENWRFVEETTGNIFKERCYGHCFAVEIV